MAAPTELNLSHLPSDVIRKIIRIGLESINDMMFISPRWKTIADGHLNDRKNLPVINMVQWTIDNNVKSIVVVRLLGRWKKFFGVEKLPSLHATSEINSDDALFENPLNYTEGKLPEIMSKIFGRCSSIENLRLNIDTNLSIEPDISMLKHAINDTSINELTIDLHQHFNANHVAMLTELLQVKSPLRLVITTSRFDIIYAFLADGVFGQIHSNIAKLVPTIEFTIDERKSRWSQQALMVAHWNSHKDDYCAKWQIANGTVNVERIDDEKCRVRIIFDAQNAK